MIRAAVIDDEPLARDIMMSLIGQYCPVIEVIGQGSDVEESAELIRTKKPELLFLDIQLRDGNAFDLLRRLDPDQHKVIFTTAFEEYAITAFRFSAIDYILKPVSPDELVSAVAKVLSHLETESAGKRLDILFENLDPALKAGRKIVLRSAANLHIVNLEEITHCQAENDHTHFFLATGEVIVVNRPLKEFEELLGRYRFIRVHPDYLVNTEHIRRYEKSNGGTIALSDETRIPVSFRKKDDFLRIIGQLH
jgi:two-component system LytT family response regulator